jgi:hypothetical protein
MGNKFNWSNDVSRLVQRHYHIFLKRDCFGGKNTRLAKTAFSCHCEAPLLGLKQSLLSGDEIATAEKNTRLAMTAFSCHCEAPLLGLKAISL